MESYFVPGGVYEYMYPGGYSHDGVVKTVLVLAAGGGSDDIFVVLTEDGHVIAKRLLKRFRRRVA